MIGVGIVGCGYWGPNLIRNFSQLKDVGVIHACDLDPGRLAHIGRMYPGVNLTNSYDDLIRDERVNVVVVATPVFTHYPLAVKALEHGKHVFIEKPMTSDVRQAEDLVRLADDRGLVLAVDHTFEYVVAVNRIKELVESGELGDIYYIGFNRLNLGLFQKDINVVWDLAPHDMSIAMYVLNARPTRVSAFGNSYVLKGVEDVAMVKLEFPGDVMAFMHVSWLDPCKVRRATVVGSRKMLVYDDVEPMEKIRIYDKRAEGPRYWDNFGEFQFSYHYGDVVIPQLKSVEPLAVGCGHFIDCVREGWRPRTDGRNGLAVVRLLEAAQQSIKNDGRPVEVTWDDV